MNHMQTLFCNQMCSPVYFCIGFNGCFWARTAIYFILKACFVNVLPNDSIPIYNSKGKMDMAESSQVSPLPHVQHFMQIDAFFLGWPHLYQVKGVKTSRTPFLEESRGEPQILLTFASPCGQISDRCCKKQILSSTAFDRFWLKFKLFNVFLDNS